MATTGARRRPQKYPDELPERAVKVVLQIAERTGERHGAVTGVATEPRDRSGVAAELGEPRRDRLGSPAGDLDRGRAEDRPARTRFESEDARETMLEIDHVELMSIQNVDVLDSQADRHLAAADVLVGGTGTFTNWLISAATEN